MRRSYPQVLAVTAGVGPGQLAPYANRGSFIDIMAPGSSVITFNGRSWRVNGTSPAAAYISGATLRIDGAQSLWGDTWQLPD